MASSALTGVQLNQAISQLTAARQLWMSAQQAFINARFDFDATGFKNRNAEEVLRVKMNSAREAAMSAQNEYYKLLNQLKSSQKLLKSLVEYNGARR